jgi:hypothetical protein
MIAYDGVTRIETLEVPQVIQQRACSPPDPCDAAAPAFDCVRGPEPDSASAVGSR